MLFQFRNSLLFGLEKFALFLLESFAFAIPLFGETQVFIYFLICELLWGNVAWGAVFVFCLFVINIHYLVDVANIKANIKATRYSAFLPTIEYFVRFERMQLRDNTLNYIALFYLLWNRKQSISFPFLSFYSTSFRLKPIMFMCASDCPRQR